jgi:hypothetical protein
VRVSGLACVRCCQSLGAATVGVVAGWGNGACSNAYILFWHLRPCSFCVPTASWPTPPGHEQHTSSIVHVWLRSKRNKVATTQFPSRFIKKNGGGPIEPRLHPSVPASLGQDNYLQGIHGLGWCQAYSYVTVFLFHVLSHSVHALPCSRPTVESWEKIFPSALVLGQCHLCHLLVFCACEMLACWCFACCLPPPLLWSRLV